jgi:hypothetical protein
MPFRACTCRKDNHNTHSEFRASTPRRLRIEIEVCVWVVVVFFSSTTTTTGIHVMDGNEVGNPELEI